MQNHNKTTKRIHVTYHNDNNNNDNVYGAVIVAQSYCESSPGSYDECGTASIIDSTWL